MSKDLSKSRKPKGRKSVAPYIHYSCNTFCRCTPICQYVQERKRRVLRQNCSFCADISLAEKKIKPICLRLFDHTNEMKQYNYITGTHEFKGQFLYFVFHVIVIPTIFTFQFSMALEADRSQKHKIERSLWHFNSMLRSSHRAISQILEPRIKDQVLDFR